LEEVILRILLGIILQRSRAIVSKDLRGAVLDWSLLMQDEIMPAHALDQVSAASFILQRPTDGGHY
jgi:hypothetical protein